MRLLLVEDERALADGLARGLRRDGFTVDTVYNGSDAMCAVAAQDYDIMLLDRDLPVMHGDLVCSMLRDAGHPIRILMLTASGTVPDKVAGFDCGADDYVPKPFAYAELVARIKALGRRGAVADQMPEKLACGNVVVDIRRQQASRAGQDLVLTPKEFSVLALLVQADGAWVSVEELINDVWAGADITRRSVVKATMHTLRRKLGDPDVIESAVVYGYRITGDLDDGQEPIQEPAQDTDQAQARG